PAVTGNAVLAGGSGEILDVLGIDPGRDAAAREIRLVVPEGAAHRRLLSPDSVFVPMPFAARHRLRVGSVFPVAAGGVSRDLRVAGLLELSGLAKASGGDLLVTDIF